MLEFINILLCDSTFPVKTLNFIRYISTEEWCTSRLNSATISVTLFLIAINDISEGVRSPLKSLCYTWTLFTIICHSSNSNTIQQFLLNSTNKLMLSWSKTSGFRLAPNKMSLILINRKNKRKRYQWTYVTTIKNKTQIKIFGIIFDSKAPLAPVHSTHKKILLS